MEWFKLIMTIFYAVTISINIAGIYASIKSIKSADIYERNLKNLCERVKNVQDENKATELRKAIQSCKRDLKRQKMDDLDIRIETLNKQFSR